MNHQERRRLVRRMRAAQLRRALLAVPELDPATTGAVDTAIESETAPPVVHVPGQLELPC